MGWVKVCTTDIADHSARLFKVAGKELLVMHCNNGYVVLTPICPHISGFLAQGDLSECVEAGLPKCNKHIGADGKPGLLGICDEPIYAYASREIGGELYVDLERRRLAPYQRITCSPLMRGREMSALQFNLWVNGEQKESIHADPGHSCS